VSSYAAEQGASRYDVAMAVKQAAKAETEAA
jgi:hypothetical protein